MTKETEDTKKAETEQAEAEDKKEEARLKKEEARVISAPVEPVAYNTKADKPKNDGSVSNVLITIALILSAGACIGFGCMYFGNGQNREVTVLSSDQDGNTVTFESGSIADIVSKVSPAVVSITTETRTESWFGSSTTSTAAGTGFIVTKDGYVVTNKHVVEGANTVTVTLEDGTTYEKAKVVGTDPLNDAAILKIDDAKDLPTVVLGTSTTLAPGQEVVAIGNALGVYENTVTSGVISGTGRSLTATDESYSKVEDLTDMIQTDAAINGGNSGGPLINAAGQVIGINTAYSSEGNNIGFAIPISSVKGLIQHAIDTGKVERAVIGVRYYSITPAVAKNLKLDVSEGACISEGGVISDSAADKAGLKEGDIIIKVGDTAVGEAGSLSTLIGEYKVGDNAKITYMRDGKTYETVITLSAYSDSMNKSSSDSKKDDTVENRIRRLLGE